MSTSLTRFLTAPMTSALNITPSYNFYWSFAIKNIKISSMPPREINKLLWWAQIYPSFKEELLDPEQRLGALNKFQNPDKNDPMFGINPDIEAGQLTPEETKALMEITGETIEGFT